MDSVDSNVDLELIAAFIDGRVSGEERSRAMKLLAESDEALELFANALRVQRDTAQSNVVPIATARRWRRWAAAVPFAAAAVLAVVLVPRLIGRHEQSPALQYAMAATGGESGGSTARLSPGWEQRGWSVTRGVGGSPLESPRSERGHSTSELRSTFRLGVRSVDLQVALARGDTALAGRLTNEILGNLTAIGFSETIAVNYAELRSRLAREPVERSSERASNAERKLRAFLDSSTFMFGQWIGAAELAARTHNKSFFESSLGKRGLRSAIEADGAGAEDAEVLRSIEARLTQAPSNQGLDDVHGILQTIIQRRGG